MLSGEPRSFKEQLRLEKCRMLTEYYTNVSETLLEDICDFLGEARKNVIVGNKNTLMFINKRGECVNTVNVTAKDDSFDILKINRRGVFITNSYKSSKGTSSSGGSSNNNNNNNNNNG